MSLYIHVGDGLVKCLYCARIAKPDLIFKDGMCRGCYARERRLANKEIIRSQQKSIAKATNKLAAALAKAGNSSAVSPQILEAFYSVIGGPAEYGRMLATDFQKSRGVGLTEYESMEFSYNASTVARWHDILIRYRQKEDDRLTTDISSISQEDLEATVRQVALDMILEDDDIREAVLDAALKKRPDIAKELASKSNLITFEKSGDKDIEEEDLEYEQDD